MSGFKFNSKDMLTNNFQRIIVDQISKDTPKDKVNLQTSRHKNKNQNPLNVTMFNISELLMKIPAFDSVEDTLSRFESIVAGTIGGLADKANNLPGLGLLIPDDIKAKIDQLKLVDDKNPTSTPTNGAPGSASAGATKNASDFVALCQAQAGKKYVYGARPDPSDPNPTSFDCSALVQWAASRTGVTLPRTSGAQYAACAAARLTIPVSQAFTTRGALLFRGKQPTGSEHVAICLGDGVKTIEAHSSADGVLELLVSGRVWDGAGLIPGMNY